MAKASSRNTGLEFTLVLSEEEAQYVRAALMYTNPADEYAADYAFMALDEALEGAGFPTPEDKTVFAVLYD